MWKTNIKPHYSAYNLQMCFWVSDAHSFLPFLLPLFISLCLLKNGVSLEVFWVLTVTIPCREVMFTSYPVYGLKFSNHGCGQQDQPLLLSRVYAGEPSSRVSGVRWRGHGDWAIPVTLKQSSAACDNFVKGVHCQLLTSCRKYFRKSERENGVNLNVCDVKWHNERYCSGSETMLHAPYPE